MTNQILRPRESLVTLGAGVLLLPHVGFYMCLQGSNMGEKQITLRAFVRSQPCVDSNVNGYIFVNKNFFLLGKMILYHQLGGFFNPPLYLYH